MRAVEIETVIRGYVSTQTELVLQLRRTLGLRDWRYLTDVPRRGNLEVAGTSWRFKVHGCGIRFHSDHATVDMNCHLDGDAAAFDAGRLAEYLSSLGQTSVLWAGRSAKFDYVQGPAILREMEAANAIQRLADCEGELYTLRQYCVATPKRTLAGPRPTDP